MTSIPFVDLKAQYIRLKSSIDASIQRVLDHGQFIMGPEVAEVEARLADLAGAEHCISVSSGTDALVAPMMALGIGPGDAVFVPTFTFTATAEVVALLGATPVFVDVDQQTFNICPHDLENQIAAIKLDGKLAPKLLIAVDLYGLPADYICLQEICERNGIKILADAAQSFGASYHGRNVGALALVTATSFFPAKPLGCYGDGGAVFTNDDEVANALRSIRQHGKGSEKYDIDRVGLNARFDTMQAAILLAKLDIFTEEVATRQRIAANYNALLSGVVETPFTPNESASAWAQYTVKTDDRDDLQVALKVAGVPTAIYYPRPMHLQTAYRERGFGAGDYPNANILCNRVLSLPIHPYLDDDTQNQICTTIREIIGHNT